MNAAETVYNVYTKYPPFTQLFEGCVLQTCIRVHLPGKKYDLNIGQWSMSTYKRTWFGREKQVCVAHTDYRGEPLGEYSASDIIMIFTKLDQI